VRLASLEFLAIAFSSLCPAAETRHSKGTDAQRGAVRCSEALMGKMSRGRRERRREAVFAGLALGALNPNAFIPDRRDGQS